MTDELAGGGGDVKTDADAGTVVDTGAKPDAAAVVVEKPLAAGDTAAELKTDTKAAAPDFPEDWRTRIAGENKDLLKTLERIKDPALLGKKLEELHKLAGAKAAGPKKPGEGATPEEIEAYRKEAGLPEKAALYVDNVKLPDGRVLGDDDKAIAAKFAEKVFGADYSQPQFDSAISWYMDHMEESHAQQAEADNTFKVAAKADLQKEWGADFKRNTAVIGTLFQSAPEDFKDRLFSARDAEGNLLGNDPAFMRWASSLALEINPSASIIPGGTDNAKALDGEMANLQTLMADGHSEYWQGPKAKANQARYLELITLKEKSSKR